MTGPRCPRRAFLASGLGGGLAVATGCSRGRRAALGAPLRLRVGHVLAPSEPTHAALVALGERLRARSGGRLLLEIFPSAQAGSNRDLVEQAALGANVVAHADPGFLQDYLPDLGILGAPYLFDRWEQARPLLVGSLVRDLGEELRRRAGLRLLALNWYFGPRHLIGHQPLRSPDELRGKKVRIPPNAMWRETLAAMGGTPTPLEWAETYTALGQGVVDAAEAPLSTLVDGRLYEAAGHVTLTGHFNAVSGFVMSERRFQALPAALRPLLEEELVRGGDEASRATIARQQGYEATLRARGVAVHAPDGAAFRRATRVVYDRFPRWSPGLRARVLAELGA